MHGLKATEGKNYLLPTNLKVFKIFSFNDFVACNYVIKPT